MDGYTSLYGHCSVSSSRVVMGRAGMSYIRIALLNAICFPISNHVRCISREYGTCGWCMDEMGGACISHLTWRHRGCEVWWYVMYTSYKHIYYIHMLIASY